MWTVTWTAMWPVLGLACVAWTSLELIRFWNASRVPIVLDCERPSANMKSRPSMNRKRFAAWDERGRVIVVDDLGPH